MQVLSPVGRFRVSLGGVRMDRGRPVLDVRMGAWRSEVTLEPRDLPLLGAAAGIVACAAWGGWRAGLRSRAAS
ncbi:MAG TPA: hypothetical protein VHW64_01730 [Nocardioides sp.]|jgi:hypothetical protein|uniref:hypothetical protein n=1 Tax=Nocardioides sp. TaxID=35761 RepID=UPI002E373B2B|nr:hypothetical protein [Nocardioides sp.]HEX3929394.1 hypothetical protein [Nocardioides sp.]